MGIDQKKLAEMASEMIGFERIGRPQPRPPLFTDEQMAEQVHETNRAYQRLIGEAEISPPWAEAPTWQRESAIAGVRKFIANGGSFSPHQQHDDWMDMKLRAGWRYGEKKDGEAKTHPCLLPYHSLPARQKVKDHLFAHVLTALMELREEPAPEGTAKV